MLYRRPETPIVLQDSEQGFLVAMVKRIILSVEWNRAFVDSKGRWLKNMTAEEVFGGQTISVSFALPTDLTQLGTGMRKTLTALGFDYKERSFHVYGGDDWVLSFRVPEDWPKSTAPVTHSKFHGNLEAYYRDMTYIAMAIS